MHNRDDIFFKAATSKKRINEFDFGKLSQQADLSVNICQPEL
jgi:hypothetical protein